MEKPTRGVVILDIAESGKNRCNQKRSFSVGAAARRNLRDFQQGPKPMNAPIGCVLVIPLQGPLSPRLGSSGRTF